MVSGQFESARVHPRRRPVINTSLTPEAESSSSKMQLKKGETFNTPTNPPSSDRDPVLNIRSLPRRSPTSLDAIAASEQRMASILERLTLDDQPEDNSSSVDTLEGLRSVHDVNAESKSAISTPSTPSSEDGYDLFPLDKKEQQQQNQQHQRDQDRGHESDSGLGSSVSSRDSQADPIEKDLHMEQSPITKSASDILQGTSPRRQLSYAACKKIERFILVPILKEPKLKPFHPLVRSIPTRIVNKQVVCLRDLEKILLWLAPNFSASRSSYLGFCEFTIQCLHTSASHLNARDQRLPADRPYTNGYFLDLVTQVRRYAAMIQANRQRVQATQDAQAQSTKKDEQPSLIPSAALEGGLSQNGRPVELVVVQDGKLISMATGLPYQGTIPATVKRAIDLSDEQQHDEGVQRSMARRKKNAPPMDINQKCAHCDKVFKRPCDLTKHEKTHSRPWKCTETDCKYYQIGWPTEKERDRHVNDKHSDTPNIFSCNFPPCTYNSKRESNCKQHMEKAHGWVYVRSKHSSRAMGARSNRGTSMRANSAQATPATPSVSTPASGPTDFSTPSVGPTPSPYEAAIEFPENLEFNFADPPPVALGNGFPSFIETFNTVEAADTAKIETGIDNYMGYVQSPYHTSTSGSVTNDGSLENYGGFNPSPQSVSYSAGMSNDQVLSHDPVFTSVDFDGLASLQAQFAAADPQSLITHLDGFNSYQVQQPIASDLEGLETGFKGYSEDQYMLDVQQVENQFVGAPAPVSGLSPGAQGNIMLFSPDLGMSGGNISQDFPFGVAMAQQHGTDFTLYGDATPGPQLQGTPQPYGQGQYLPTN
ncbi:hypothetical protein PMG11_06075 [Penicillium brasilianum]|uniref:C2H2-type domain-containing protein n=1 Tax=Penicillium brasilianum TaxID=104259 RepID=A0A0F7TND8_PENBI|nr:hypothetical protein PMG11_06075 [Penicillium brasilianum]